jgi:hypothetical protein
MWSNNQKEHRKKGRIRKEDERSDKKRKIRWRKA